jgi:hypothetical protein
MDATSSDVYLSRALKKFIAAQPLPRDGKARLLKAAIYNTSHETLKPVLNVPASELPDKLMLAATTCLLEARLVSFRPMA